MKWSLAFILTAAGFVGLVSDSSGHPGLHRELDWLTAVVDAEPFNVDALLKRSALAIRHGDLLLAWSDLMSAEAISPAHPSTTLQRGFVCVSLSLNVCADRALTEALRHRPDLIEARVARARARRDLGLLEGALDDFEAVVSVRYDVQIFLERAQTRRQLGDLEGAASALRADLKRSGATVLRAALIDVEVERGAFNEALTLIAPLLRKSGVKARWRLRRAEILRAAKRTRESEADLARALAESHDQIKRRRTALSLILRGRIYLAMQQHKLALADFDAALKKTPHHREAERLRRHTDELLSQP